MLLVLFKTFSKKFNTQPGKAYQGENEVEEIINLDWLRLGLSTSANIQRIGEKKIYYTHYIHTNPGPSISLAGKIVKS